MSRASVFFLFTAVLFLAVSGCGRIEGLSLPYVASPRVEVQTPTSPAEGNITISFQLIDREVEPADITVEYSTNGGTTYSTATLTIPGDATNLASAWHPGKTHTVTWNSVTDMVGRSGAVSVCVKITPSDASNPSGTPGISGSFTVNNIAYNEAPTATAATPAGVQSGNVQINYFLADVESDTCSIAVLYSTNDGTSYQAATMGPAGDGVSGLSSSPSGTAHVYLWDSRADNVAPSGQVDTIKIRITPTDFNAGTPGETNSFSVDNSVANDPPTVAITGGPVDGSTVTTTQVTFTWSGSDTDGSVVGYYYSFDHDPPDVWTTNTTVTSGALSEASHIFRVVAVDDDSDLSTVASRSFTVSIPGTIIADFSGSPTTGVAPLTVNFTDESSATNGIDTWSWEFGDMSVSDQRNPQHTYFGAGTFTVSLTVTGPDGTDTETKTNYITVTAPGGDTIYVDAVDGDDGRSGLDWANAVKTIQTGLDKASDNWTVLVADGTYIGLLNKNLDFGGRAIHLKSAGGAAKCIIDCENSGRGFYFHSGETNAAIVEGFTIQNCVADYGGGIRCDNASSPTFSNCVISGNSADWHGGGVFCSNSSSPTFTNCNISGNAATTHRGGGVFCSYTSSPTFTNCDISGNSADWGGGVHCRATSNPTFTNCDISGNSAGYGGGVYCHNNYSSIPIFTNCTISGNTAVNYGGGVYCKESSSPTFRNSIIRDNTAGISGHQIYNYDAGFSVTLLYTCYSDGAGDIAGSGSVTPDANCITSDPLFVNATAQDYHLQAGSPCIDAGNNSLVPPEVTTDLDGNARIANSIVDMGAYEYGSSPPELEYCWTRVIGGTDEDQANGVCTDGSGNLYMVGYFRDSTVNFAEDWGGSDTKISAGYRDIFVTKIDSNGSYCWTHRMGGTLEDYGHAICADAGSNIYVAGSFRSTVNFAADWGASDTKTTGDLSDIFVTKIDAGGNYCWTKQMGGSDQDTAYAVCTDGSDNVYVAGYFGFNTAGYTVNFAADWGGTDTKTSAAGSRDVFITKIAANGDYCWTRRMGGIYSDGCYAICVDAGDNVCVAGWFNSEVNFADDWGGSDTKTSAAWDDAFVTKIDSNGDYCWTHTMGGSDFEQAHAVCTDISGNVYVAGDFNSGTVNFAADWGGSDTKTSAGEADAFITKITSSGGYVWTRRIGGSAEDDAAHAIGTDASGNVYAAGFFHGSVNFAQDWAGSDTKTSAGEADIFITTIDAGGDYCWTRRMGAAGYEMARTLCLDGTGSLYVAGGFDSSSVNFAADWGGSDTKTNAGGSDIFVTKITQP